MQIALLKEKNKPKSAKTFEPLKKNKGVELRNLADLQRNSQETVDSKAKLFEKSKLYEKLGAYFLAIFKTIYCVLAETGANIKETLVDFSQKRLDNESIENRREFESQRKRFYEEKKREFAEREKEIVERRIQHARGDLYKEIDRSEAERLQWEKQAFKEIEQGITEES